MVPEAQPIWFGRQRPRCFGTLHSPGTAATRGVVICNGLGYEGLISYRPLADLAERLVASGYEVLRFDYHGTGDSDGGDWDPGRVQDWLDSIDEAVGVLGARQGIQEVYLAGIRLGATLACLYANDHPGVAGLALWAPCPDGSAYVRELRALSRLSAAARPPQRVAADWFPQDSLEIAGFELSKQTAEDLRGIDLVKALRRAPAPAVVVVDHTDRPSADALTQKLLQLGSRVEHVRVPGYAEFMVDDETRSVMPVEALDQLTGWFASVESGSERISTKPVRVSHTLVVDTPAPEHRFRPGMQCPPVVEKATRAPGGLFAIVSEPDDSAISRRVAVVILNTGATNRVGQGRLSTELSRYLASLGFTVVRVDLGGTGDTPLSVPTHANTTYEPGRIEEVVRVVNWVRDRGHIDRVVLFGICSGAYQSFHAAQRGVDVDMAVLVNPAIWYDDAHRQAGMAIYVAHNSTSAIFRLSKWRRLVREPKTMMVSLRNARSGFTYLAKTRARLGLRKLGYELPDVVALSGDLDQICQRGVKLVIVFAAAEIGATYLRTFGGSVVAALERNGQIADVDGGDHVFSSPGARQRLVEIVTQRLDVTYPRRPTSSVADGATPPGGVGLGGSSLTVVKGIALEGDLR